MWIEIRKKDVQKPVLVFEHPFFVRPLLLYSMTTGDSGAFLRMLSMPLRQPALAL